MYGCDVSQAASMHLSSNNESAHTYAPQTASVPAKRLEAGGEKFGPEEGGAPPEAGEGPSPEHSLPLRLHWIGLFDLGAIRQLGINPETL